MDGFLNICMPVIAHIYLRMKCTCGIEKYFLHILFRVGLYCCHATREETIRKQSGRICKSYLESV